MKRTEITSSARRSPVGLHEWQRRFAAALLDPDLPVPHGLIGPDRRPVIRRFNVYRNNVVTGLVEALRAAFPAVCRITGDAFFAAMARVYVARTPPRSPVMLDYGHAFPDFVQAFEPAKSVPYLSDVARLERACTESYHAAESLPIDVDTLSEIDPRNLPQIRFMLHPSLRVVSSSFPVVRLWLMNIEGGEPAPIDTTGQSENAIVVRPFAEVEVRPVTSGTAAFLQRLASGASVAHATTLAIDEEPDFDLAGALGELFLGRVIIGWDVRDSINATTTVRYA